MGAVLAVDDHLEMLRMLQDIVTHMGYRYYAATTAEQAILLAETYQPDIVVTDLALNDTLNGLQLAHQLRLIDPRIIVIAITAENIVYSRVAALAAGCAEYIEKPFPMRNLIDIIERYMFITLREPLGERY